ncbi:hypothetical protein LOTGIDRAFT_235573 [Lottia gigantea]|uniref:Sorting nexin-17 n=1 Tax=Lottia gigantea TaxID=225164 RepID=V4BAI9_LOTGI|nr:hypothetical protein LOTGIDRAFT_235573 [Lottia gigantea]ESO85974.1 hypothetical protein LOTGIDRAFT_235573 [Lottia gigantea]
MHFSIPDTEECKDEGGTAFTSYNLYINGVYHCQLRYRQLHQFHEQMKKEFGVQNLPQFPPKKLLSLSPLQIEERRSMLERYVQLLSQDVKICNSDIFNGFLLNAQQETQKEAPEKVTLNVFLMNGHKITVNINSTDQTDDVLECVAGEIHIPDDFVYYFGLYLVKKEHGGENSIVRKLQEFESPFISLRSANKDCVHRIVLRKSYWDSSFDDELLDNKITMNLLYVQTLNDIERQWILASKDQVKHLASLQERGSKKEYVRFARTLRYYGYLQFLPCFTDYPKPNCRVLIAAGNKELNFRIQVDDEIKEGSFSITRMRCWRITTTLSDDENGSTGSSRKQKLELSFEYLMSRETLKWVTITSDQAMLLSMSLQNMVDELLMKKQARKLKRDKLTKGGKSAENGVTENSVFGGIGDDDL